jgi:hypothetical protein
MLGLIRSGEVQTFALTRYPTQFVVEHEPLLNWIHTRRGGFPKKVVTLDWTPED